MADDLFPEPSAQESQMVHPNNGRSLKQEDYIAGLAKGLAILDCFDSGQVRLSVTKAAERTGLTRAAARRHLRTLFYLGYLDGDGQQFWLSPKILKPAGIYLNSAALPRAARAVLRSLPKQTGCYHSVVVLSGGEAVTVASCYPPHLEQAQVLPYGIYSGNRIPAHTGANGKVLLAALNAAQLEQWLVAYPLMRFTTQTLTDRSLLQQQLAEVRQQGWAEGEGADDVVADFAVLAQKQYGTQVVRVECGRRCGRSAVEPQLGPAQPQHIPARFQAFVECFGGHGRSLHGAVGKQAWFHRNCFQVACRIWRLPESGFR